MDLHRYRRQLVINWAFFREKKKEIGVKVTLRIYSTSFLGKFTGGFFLWNCRFHVFITLPNWKYPCNKLITPDHGLLCTQWQTSPWIQHSSLSLNSRITWEVFLFLFGEQSLVLTFRTKHSCFWKLSTSGPVACQGTIQWQSLWGQICAPSTGGQRLPSSPWFLPKKKKSMGFILPN